MKKEPLSTKDKIFQTSVDLFATKGYHGTSIRDIAGTVGIKESSIYNHFKGKKAILKAILDYQLEGFQKGIGALDMLKNTDVDKISDAVDFWMAGTGEFLKNIPELTEKIYRILINEMFLNKDCRRFYLNVLLKSQKELVETILTVMHQKGMIEDCDIKKTANQYIYMLQGLEIENKLRIMEGHNPSEIQQNLFEQITLFIQRIKK